MKLKTLHRKREEGYVGEQRIEKKKKKLKFLENLEKKRLELIEREGRRRKKRKKEKKKRGSTKKTQEFICWIRIDEKSKPTTREREREREDMYGFVDLWERDQKEDMKEVVEDEEASK